MVQDFVSTLFISLVGRQPEKAEKIVLNSILVSPIDNTESVVEAMKLFKNISESSDDIEKSVSDLVSNYSLSQRIVPGFGHNLYKDYDPRVKSLFLVARENDLDIHFMNIARQFEHSIEDLFNEKKVLNIDGAIAALLLTLGIDPIASNAVISICKIIQK